MSKDFAYIIIAKMHIKLNKLIEDNDFDLLCHEVQHYSRRLDKVLVSYNKKLAKNVPSDCDSSRLNNISVLLKM